MDIPLCTCLLKAEMCVQWEVLATLLMLACVVHSELVLLGHTSGRLGNDSAPPSHQL